MQLHAWQIIWQGVQALGRSNSVSIFGTASTDVRTLAQNKTPGRYSMGQPKGGWHLGPSWRVVIKF